MSKDNVTTALTLAAELPNTLRKARSNSLIEYTKSTRVEPIVLLDDKLVNISFMEDVMQSLTSLFSGYYLQAVSLMVDVGNVSVVGLLDSVNPDRDPLGSFGVVNKLASLESYEYGLPTPDGKVGLEHFGLEATILKNNTKGTTTVNGDIKVNIPKNDSDKKGKSFDLGKDTLQTVRTPSTLAVGKMLEVKVSSNGNEATFPVSVRLIPVGARSEDIVRTMSVGATDISFMGRIHAWRSGQIEFVKDLILCQDLISNHRKGLINDKTGMYKQSVKRSNKNAIASLLSGEVSVGTASNIVVISSHTAKQIEKEIGGKLKHFKTREKLFKDTYVMMLAVIDPDWEAITLYSRSIEMASDLSARDVKQMGKKDVDVGEILKAYQMGNSPSF